MGTKKECVEWGFQKALEFNFINMQNNPVIYLMKKMWRYAEGNRRNVVAYVLLFVIANSISFLEPLVIARMLNTVQERGITSVSIPSLLWYLAALLVISLGFWTFHGPARVIENKNAFLVRAHYKKYLIDGVMAFPISWHTDHHSGDTIDKIEKGTTALFNYSSNTFMTIQSIVRLVSSYIALSYFNLHAGYIVLFMVVVTIILIMQFDKVLVRQYRAIYGAENKISEKIFDAISNITTVIILRIETLVSSSIYEKIMEPFGLYTRNKKMGETKWFLVSVCSTAMTVSVLGSYFYVSVQTHAIILAGTVYALYGYVGRISDLFFNFAYMYGNILQQKAAVMNAEEIANEFQNEKKVAQIHLGSQWKELKIDSLRFSYHTKEGADLHLDDISLNVGRKERIALIGESGSGKTTLLKVIRELYRPQYVNVFLDGKQLPHNFESISSDIALIPQDPEIFSTTIKENITVGVEYDNAYIKKFTDMACFTDVAENLPNKLDSFIFEKGVNLSGGEKQRLALARGLMACDDKSIVLLDEPTSSVDTKNELVIFQNILNEFKEKTIIASVHRLHLLTLFNTIYYFKAGKIIASGTLEDLMISSSEFQELWKKYHTSSGRVHKFTYILDSIAESKQ